MMKTLQRESHHPISKISASTDVHALSHPHLGAQERIAVASVCISGRNKEGIIA